MGDVQCCVLKQGRNRAWVVVSMGVQDPEVTSRSRDVNKDGGEVNDLPTPN